MALKVVYTAEYASTAKSAVDSDGRVRQELTSTPSTRVRTWRLTGATPGDFDFETAVPTQWAFLSPTVVHALSVSLCGPYVVPNVYNTLLLWILIQIL